MLAANYDICCTPYRLKDASMKESYPVSFENYDKIEITDKGFVQCPFGLFFVSKNEAKQYASKNINDYYEIHKDYFVE